MLDAAAEYGRAFPMMMTAAGTIAAARVFVMGVGVAGLQAIATARRLGAHGLGDRRPRRDQGADREPRRQGDVRRERWPGIEGEGAGGYATEMSDEYKAAQAELVSGHIAKQDIVITTALIPGRPAPRLITDAQIATMRPGSVIVDLAVEQGGNVEGAVAGEVVERHGVQDRRPPQRAEPARRRRLGALRAQPLQFPLRLLGRGGEQGAGRCPTRTRSCRACG